MSGAGRPDQLLGWVTWIVGSIFVAAMVESYKALYEIAKQAKVTIPGPWPWIVDGFIIAVALVRVAAARSGLRAPWLLTWGMWLATGFSAAIQIAYAPAGMANKVVHAVAPVAVFASFEALLWLRKQQQRSPVTTGRDVGLDGGRDQGWSATFEGTTSGRDHARLAGRDHADHTGRPVAARSEGSAANGHALPGADRARIGDALGLALDGHSAEDQTDELAGATGLVRTSSAAGRDHGQRSPIESTATGRDRNLAHGRDHRHGRRGRDHDDRDHDGRATATSDRDRPSPASRPRPAPRSQPSDRDVEAALAAAYATKPPETWTKRSLAAAAGCGATKAGQYLAARRAEQEQGPTPPVVELVRPALAALPPPDGADRQADRQANRQEEVAAR